MMRLAKPTWVSSSTNTPSFHPVLARRWHVQGKGVAIIHHTLAGTVCDHGRLKFFGELAF
jgi:hypothetical protein